jgi:hypothetical protein
MIDLSPEAIMRDAFSQLMRDILPTCISLNKIMAAQRRPLRREQYPAMRDLYRRGKTSAEMAVILHTSRRSVYKHLTQALHVPRGR